MSKQATSPMQLKSRRSSNTKPATTSQTGISSASPLRPLALGDPLLNDSCGPSLKPEAARKMFLHDATGATQSRSPLPFRLRFIAATFASLQYLLRLLRSWLRLLQMIESALSVTITTKNGTETVERHGLTNFAHNFCSLVTCCFIPLDGLDD